MVIGYYSGTEMYTILYDMKELNRTLGREEMSVIVKELKPHFYTSAMI